MSRRETAWSPSWLDARAGAVLVAVLALAVQANSLSTDFAYDDVLEVVANRAGVHPADRRAILLTQSWGGPLSCRPVKVFTFALDFPPHGARFHGDPISSETGPARGTVR